MYKNIWNFIEQRVLSPHGFSVAAKAPMCSYIFVNYAVQWLNVYMRITLRYRSIYAACLLFRNCSGLTTFADGPQQYITSHFCTMLKWSPAHTCIFNTQRDWTRLVLPNVRPRPEPKLYFCFISFVTDTNSESFFAVRYRVLSSLTHYFRTTKLSITLQWSLSFYVSNYLCQIQVLRSSVSTVCPQRIPFVH